MCARLKSNQGSARPKSADQPTEINTTAGRVIILELLVRASCSAVNERRTKMAIHTIPPVFCLNIAGRAVNVLAATNFCSCAQFLIILPPTNYIALIGAHRSKKWCAHNGTADESYLFSSFFCRQACRLLLTKVAILCTISGCSPTACWHLSD